MGACVRAWHFQEHNNPAPTARVGVHVWDAETHCFHILVYLKRLYFSTASGSSACMEVNKEPPPRLCSRGLHHQPPTEECCAQVGPTSAGQTTTTGVELPKKKAAQSPFIEELTSGSYGRHKREVVWDAMQTTVYTVHFQGNNQPPRLRC
jgi:hypothetical protein